MYNTHTGKKKNDGGITHKTCSNSFASFILHFVIAPKNFRDLYQFCKYVFDNTEIFSEVKFVRAQGVCVLCMEMCARSICQKGERMQKLCT